MQDNSFLFKEKSPESQLQGEINYEKSFKQWQTCIYIDIKQPV